MVELVDSRDMQNNNASEKTVNTAQFNDLVKTMFATMARCEISILSELEKKNSVIIVCKLLQINIRIVNNIHIS